MSEENKELWQIGVEEITGHYGPGDLNRADVICNTPLYLAGQALAQKTHDGEYGDTPMHVVHEEIFKTADRAIAGIIAYGFDVKMRELS